MPSSPAQLLGVGGGTLGLELLEDRRVVRDRGVNLLLALLGDLVDGALGLADRLDDGLGEALLGELLDGWAVDEAELGQLLLEVQASA